MTEARKPPTRPVGPIWTEAQQWAIETEGCDLAVSASAGSGKTAVLTERVFRLTTQPGPDGQAPIPLDRMLVITFTEKAATQMRDRIERRLVRALEEEPGCAHSGRALDVLPGAWIMTIDAFCRRILLENFYRVRISPTFRVPEPAELRDLERQVVEGLLEDWAREAGRRERLGDLLGTVRRGSEGLIGEVRAFMNFLESLDRPDQWLGRVREVLEAAGAAESFEQLPDLPVAAKAFGRHTRQLAAAVKELAMVAEALHGASEAADHWRELAGDLEALADKGTFRPDEILRWIERQQFDKRLGKIANKGTLQQVGGEVLYKADGERFKRNFLEPLQKHYDVWRTRTWLRLPEAARLQGARLAARQGGVLVDLAEQALERLDEAKRRQALISFNDQERLTLQILSDPARPEAPSEVARLLQKRFLHVLVDEYQDTSPLQDAIVRRVSRAEDPMPGVAGNLFLVGDFKQSIYRFRHAEPRLFQGWLTDCHEDGAAPGGLPRRRRVNLSHNFRSRSGLLEFVNACFERLVDREVGEMDYDEMARLKPGRVDPAEMEPTCVEVHWLPKQNDPEENHAEELEPPLKGKEAQAVWVARRLRELTDPESGVMIPDEGATDEKGRPVLRRARPGDCAILVRSLKPELDTWTEALQQVGLWVHAPGVNPLFNVPELKDLVAALKLADNPFQDLPLAAVLRSPIVDCSDEQLLAIRMQRPQGPFHAAVWAAAGRQPVVREPEEQDAQEPPELEKGVAERIGRFMEQLDRWRALASMGPAEEVLDAIVSDSDYEAWLLGRLDATERLGRVDYLRGLLQRFGRGDGGRNPLASFLRVLDSVEQDTQSLEDLPESIMDEGDAVHLLTIHKSKGLEFPIVVLPRLERRFHRPQAVVATQYDRRFGLARAGVDVKRRRLYPTLAQEVLQDERQRQDWAEEMRLLYVAMTRARERLVLVGQLARMDQVREKWSAAKIRRGRPAGALERLHAGAPIDLLGPIVQELAGVRGGPGWLRIETHPEMPPGTQSGDGHWADIRQALARSGGDPEADWERASERLNRLGERQQADLASGWGPKDHGEPLVLLPSVDPWRSLANLPAKTTVTQLRRVRHRIDWAGFGDPAEQARLIEQEMQRPYFARKGKLADRRPAWLAESERDSAVRRGELTHQLLAQLDLGGPFDPDGLRRQASRLADQGRLNVETEERHWLDRIDYEAIVWFFVETSAGRRMRAESGRVSRELPLTAAKAAGDFSPDAGRAFPQERILVQGIIDAVIDEGAAATVLEYKTDRVSGNTHLQALIERYEFQVNQYARSLQRIWGVDEVRAYLVFLDGRTIVNIPDCDD